MMRSEGPKAGWRCLASLCVAGARSLNARYVACRGLNCRVTQTDTVIWEGEHIKMSPRRPPRGCLYSPASHFTQHPNTIPTKNHDLFHPSGQTRTLSNHNSTNLTPTNTMLDPLPPCHCTCGCDNPVAEPMTFCDTCIEANHVNMYKPSPSPDNTSRDASDDEE